MKWMAAALLLLALPAWANDPKGLTPAQIDSLRAARGMGMSLPAELNGKPGPLHVLELAEPLALDQAQHDAMTALVAGMKEEAVEVGERIIAAERELDTLFAAPQPDEAAIAAKVAEIARLNGDLRLVHLNTHLAASRVLSAEQNERYTALRRHHHGG